MANQTRKAKTAMVFNPNRGLSIGGRRSTVKRVSSARTNPVRKAIAKTNPRRKSVRRRHNPASTTELIVTGVMAGIGVTVFDVLTTKVVPFTSPLIRVGTKLGGAWLFQSSIGNKIPFLGKYKNDIALVLAVSAVIDLGKLYVLPAIAPFTGGLLTASTPQLLDAPAGDLANVYAYQ